MTCSSLLTLRILVFPQLAAARLSWVLRGRIVAEEARTLSFASLAFTRFAFIGRIVSAGRSLRQLWEILKRAVVTEADAMSTREECIVDPQATRS